MQWQFVMKVCGPRVGFAGSLYGSEKTLKTNKKYEWPDPTMIKLLYKCGNTFYY